MYKWKKLMYNNSLLNYSEGFSMKAYGHSRRDKLECKYGCCTTKSGKECNSREVVDKANRKTARQSGKKEVNYYVVE